MDAKILSQAQKDIPLYFKDFEDFWKSTTDAYNDFDLANCYGVTLLFKNWKISLNHIRIKNLDTILNELHEDINASFFHSYFGHYRSAHMHLRSVIELSLQMIYFYQHEVEFELWKLAEFRIKHEELTAYLKKHPKFKSNRFTDLINDITVDWKLFSKYIHAEAPNYFHATGQSVVTKRISKKDFGIWKSNYLRTAKRVNKLLLNFFGDESNRFPSKNREFLLRGLNAQELRDVGIVP
jgi:hypothetical protein